MINVSKEQLEQVEYIIGQSIQGNHVLFDLETVRRVFNNRSTPTANVEEAYSVEHHIERLIGHPTLSEKRAYLDGLDADTYEKVVRTYFNIVENNLFENAAGSRH